MHCVSKRGIAVENGQEVGYVGKVTSKGSGGWPQRVERKADMLGRSLT